MLSSKFICLFVLQVKLGSQYYFYMETQTARAVPDDGSCIFVYSSTQPAEHMHHTIGKCLGIPDHNVRVVTRRVGGAFGGKLMRSMPVSIINMQIKFFVNVFLAYALSLSYFAAIQSGLVCQIR